MVSKGVKLLLYSLYCETNTLWNHTIELYAALVYCTFNSSMRKYYPNLALISNLKILNKETNLKKQALVNDKRTTVDNIVTSPLMQGIFDKWTWDGTGRFVFSLALTIGYGLYGPLKQRYAVNKV